MADTKAQLPWLNEPLPLDEAVEALAQASNEEANETEALVDHIEALADRFEELEARIAELEDRVDERADAGDGAVAAESELTDRVETLEDCVEASNDGTIVTCPSCDDDDALKSGVAAAVLLRRESLSDKNIRALNEESHLCLSCKTAFTPCEISSEGDA